MHDERAALALVSNMGLMAEQFARDCQGVRHDMQQFARQTPGLVQQSVQAQLRFIPNEVTDRVHQGLDKPLADCEQRLREAGDRALKATQTLAEQWRRIESLHRHLVWKVAGIALGTLAVLLVGGIWLSTYYMGVIRDNQISADLLRAYNQADVTLCNGRLCARVGKKYVPVEPRP
jgi:hypothetical protein